MKKNYILLILILIVILPYKAFAHQPRIVSGNLVEINNPEVSQAFYGELKGTSTEFEIKSDKNFNLYVGLLVPDIKNVKKDISAEIYRLKDDGKEILASLDGSKFKWTPFYEEFAKDNYFWGPEFNATSSEKGVDLKGQPVPAGDYIISVYSPTNSGKYSLVTGYEETFPIKEIINALFVIPILKINFFNYPIKELIVSPYIYGPIIFLVIFVLMIRFIFKLITKRNQ